MATYEIIPRAAWGAKPPSQPLSPMTQPDGWVIHYVGGPCQQDPTLAQSVSLVRNLQEDAMADTAEGYIDIEYNFLVDLNGRIFEGRGWDYKSGANGSSNYNAHAWAACVLMGPGDGKPSDKNHLTQEAKDALTWLTREGAKRRASVSYVKGHRDVYATHCPGDELYAYVPELNRTLHLVDIPKPIDWKAIEHLAKWIAACTRDPLRYEDERPAVVDLKKVMALRGHDVGNRTPFYGKRLVKAVHEWKVEVGHPNTDGKVFGGPAAQRSMKP